MDMLPVEEAEFARSWYILDENCLGEEGSVAPKFVLKNQTENTLRCIDIPTTGQDGLKPENPDNISYFRKDKERLLSTVHNAAINLWQDEKKSDR